MEPMADGAYARAGVDQLLSGNAVAALVDVLAGIRTGRPSRAALASGHYANVLRLDERRGLALSCDSVGSKVIVCEQLGRYDTIGIDLFGMNANDVICARDGDDHVSGLAGDDLVIGARGGDTISGDDGSDLELGQQGNDTLLGRAGYDVLDGGPGTDTCGAGADGAFRRLCEA